MTTFRSLSLLAALALVLVVSGRPAGAAGPPYPCTLISEAEVAAAIGETTQAPLFNPNYNLGQRCTYTAADSKIVVLQTFDPKLVDEMGHIHAYVAVPGLGTKAYMNEGALYIRKGKKALELDIRLPDQLTTLTPPAAKIAHTVADRM